MASGINPLGYSSGSNSNSNSNSNSLTAPPTEQMFLQLLVAQLKNQDPLNPADSTQFVSQLAQFSELEQVMGIRSDIENYHSQAAAAASADSSTSGSNSTSGS
jgi:flagellar basal-body rod modification protein FlgD